MNRIVRSLLILSTLLFCHTARADAGQQAATFEPVAAGIERAIVQTRTREDAPPMNVWIYRPVASRAERLPCVLVPASGSNGLTGVALNDDLLPEHLPYVQNGCIVVAFDIDGAIDTTTPPDLYVSRLHDFVKCGGGVANAEAALRSAMDIEPRIDTDRLLAAGHGSGANVVLLLAASDPRIRALAAFSPLDDAVARIGDASIDAMNTAIPGYRDFLARTQPRSIAEQIKARVLLFHPADDPMAPVATSRELAEKMKAAGNAPHVIEPRAGGHVEAMLSTGLKDASTWLAEIARRLPATQPASAKP